MPLGVAPMDAGGPGAGFGASSASTPMAAPSRPGDFLSNAQNVTPASPLRTIAPGAQQDYQRQLGAWQMAYDINPNNPRNPTKPLPPVANYGTATGAAGPRPQDYLPNAAGPIDPLSEWLKAQNINLGAANTTAQTGLGLQQQQNNALADYNVSQLWRQFQQTGDLASQSKYRDVALGRRQNDADLFNANAGYSNLQNELAGKTTAANQTMAEQQRDYEAQKYWRDQEYKYNQQDANLAYDKSIRGTLSNAAAKGSITSSGFGDTNRETQRERDITLGSAEAVHGRWISSLLNSLNNGQISHADAMNAIAAAGAAGLTANNKANTDYGINKDRLTSVANTYWTQQQGRYGQYEADKTRQGMDATNANGALATQGQQADDQLAIARQQAYAQFLQSGGQ